MVQVPYENIPDAIQPGLTEPQRIQSSPDSFGAQVGAATQGLGRALQNASTELGSLYLRHQNNVQSSIYERDFQDFQSTSRIRLSEMEREAAGTNPTGLAQRFQTWQREEAQRRLSRIPEAQRSSWQTRYNGVEAAFRPQSVGTELRIGDATSDTNLNRTQEDLTRRAYQDPSPQNREALYREAEAAIRNSTVPEGQREERIRIARQSIDRMAATREAASDPEAVAATLSGNTNYRAVMQRREGTGPNPNSTAIGHGQFLDTTWGRAGDPRNRGYANSERGRAAGLRPIPPGVRGGPNDPRTDPQQAAIAMRLMEEDSERALRAANLPVTGGNMYLLHFLGQAGGVRMLRANATNPGALASEHADPEAVRANQNVFFTGAGGRSERTLNRQPRTVAQLVAWAQQGFGPGSPVPPSDGRLDYIRQLPAQDQITIGQQATVNAQRQAAQETERFNTQAAEVTNNLSAGITDGRVGRAQVQAAWDAGLFTDNSSRERLFRQIDSRDAGLASQAELATRIARGDLNPQSPADRTLVNNNWDQALAANNGNRIAAGMQMWERTRGVMPTEGAAALMQAITSTNQQQVMEAMQHLMRIRSSGYSTDQFAGMPNAEQLREAADTATFYSNINGGNLAEAAAVITQRNLPEHQRTNAGNRERTRAFTEQLQRTEASTIQGQINGWFASLRGERGQFMPGQDQAALSDYIQFATDEYDRYGDPARARAYATERLQRVWGNSNGWITRMPPERVFPEVVLPDGTRSRDYIYDQAQQVATRFMGRPVAREDIQLVQIPGITSRYWNQGAFTVEDIQSGRREAPPYGMVIRTPGPGGYFTAEIVPVPGTSLMLPFRSDPRAAQTTTEPAPMTRARLQAQSEEANRLQYHYENQLPMRMPDGQNRVPTEAEVAATRGVTDQNREPIRQLDERITREQIRRDQRTRDQQPGGDPAPRRVDPPTWPPTPQDGF